MFIATATAICSLGHGLRTFTAAPKSLSALHPSRVAKSSTSFGFGNVTCHVCRVAGNTVRSRVARESPPRVDAETCYPQRPRR